MSLLENKTYLLISSAVLVSLAAVSFWGVQREVNFCLASTRQARQQYPDCFVYSNNSISVGCYPSGYQNQTQYQNSLYQYFNADCDPVGKMVIPHAERAIIALLTSILLATAGTLMLGAFVRAACLSRKNKPAMTNKATAVSGSYVALPNALSGKGPGRAAIVPFDSTFVP